MPPVSNQFQLLFVLFFWIVWIPVFLLSLKMLPHCELLVIYRFVVLFVKVMLFSFQWKTDWKVHIILDIYYFLHILFCMDNLDIQVFWILILIHHLSLLFHRLLIFDYLRQVNSIFMGSKCMLHFACGLSLHVPFDFIASFLSGIIGIIPCEYAYFIWSKP